MTLATLRKLEWASARTELRNRSTITTVYRCPVCESEKPTHAPDCELDADIRESERRETGERPEIRVRECSTCAAKPGSPLLCDGCLHNRTALDTLTRALVEQQGKLSAARGEADFHATRAEQAESALTAMTQERDEAQRNRVEAIVAWDRMQERAVDAEEALTAAARAGQP